MALKRLFSDTTTYERLVVALLVIIAYSIWQAVYNAYFHPLAKFPGPRLWAVSRVPYIKHMVNGTMVREQIRLHQKYGPVVRLGSNELSFAKEEAWNDIHGFQAGVDVPGKDPLWYQDPNGAAENIITTKVPEVHARMRKMLSSSFSEQALRSQQPLIESYGDLFVSRLRELASAPQAAQVGGAVVNIVDWITFFTTDIIGDLALGESFHCLRDSRYHPWVQNLYQFFKGMNLAVAPRFYPLLDFLVQYMLPQSILEAVRQHQAFVDDKIAKRMNLEANRPDFMTQMMKDNPGFENMSLREIQSSFALLIPAGSETTATTLCGILNYITRGEYASVMAKLVAEIRAAFPEEADITIESIRNLKYMLAILNEGLRLCNPIPGGLFRRTPPSGSVIAGIAVPGDTTIALRPYIMAHDAKIYHRPTEFVPERWLPESERPKEFLNDKLEESQPFSIGTYACLGKPLAWAELKLLLARLIWAFEIEDPSAGKGMKWNQQGMLVMVHKEKFEVRLRERKGLQIKAQ